MGVDPLSHGTQELRVRRRGRGLAMLALAATFVVGLQLGGIPWRYRKQIWQVQGGLMGLIIGYVVGRWSSQKDEPSNDS